MKDYKRDFPQLDNDYVYIDSAATTLTPTTVIDAINDYYRNYSVNIHRGMYKQSYEATEIYENTREKVAAFIGAKTEEIVYTRGTTSALNLLAQRYGNRILNKGDDIVISELAHHSSLLPWQHIARETGANLRYVPLDSEGRLIVDNVKKTLTDKTKIVVLTHVSNVMGYLAPVKEVTELAHGIGAKVVLDAAQAVSHVPIDVKQLNVDFMAFSAHKMVGPTGIGVLFGKHDLLESMEPLEYGGDMVDFVEKDHAVWKDVPQRFEAGTMPIASVFGLSKAIDYLEAIGLKQIHDHVVKLAKMTIDGLRSIEGVEIYNKHSDSGIVTFNLKKVPSHDALSYYAEENVALRAGHHCAMLVGKKLGVNSTLRASFYLYNDEKDVRRFLDVTKQAVDYFRTLGF